MRDTVLWRKQSHIIIMLAEALQIDAERALDLFYHNDGNPTIEAYPFPLQTTHQATL